MITEAGTFRLRVGGEAGRAPISYATRQERTYGCIVRHTQRLPVRKADTHGYRESLSPSGCPLREARL
jgi:hypothetical protein